MVHATPNRIKTGIKHRIFRGWISTCKVGKPPTWRHILQIYQCFRTKRDRYCRHNFTFRFCCGMFTMSMRKLTQPNCLATLPFFILRLSNIVLSTIKNIHPLKNYITFPITNSARGILIWHFYPNGEMRFNFLWRKLGDLYSSHISSMVGVGSFPGAILMCNKFDKIKIGFDQAMESGFAGEQSTYHYERDRHTEAS